MTEAAQTTDNLTATTAAAPSTATTAATQDSATTKTTEAKPDPAAATLAAGGAADKAATAPADFPADWRAKLAASDPKELARLERFGSPGDIYKAYRALETKLTSGEYKTAKPKDATPEQLATWRAENGIPDSPDKYDLTMPNGLVIGEQDKPLVNEFLKEMHGVNATPEVTKAALTAYYKLVENQKAVTLEADGTFRQASEDALRAEWGGDFRKNVAMVSTLLDTAPEGVKDKLLSGRTMDGRLLGDDPAVMKFLVGMAREINPVATVVPNAGFNGANAIGDEIATMNKLMGDKSSEYWTGPKAPGGKETLMQVRYRELVNAQEKLKKRA